MFKMYSAKEVRTLVQRLKEEYDGVLKRQREVTEEIREDNRRLRARLSVLEGQRGRSPKRSCAPLRKGNASKGGERTGGKRPQRAQTAGGEMPPFVRPPQCQVSRRRGRFRFSGVHPFPSRLSRRGRAGRARIRYGRSAQPQISARSFETVQGARSYGRRLLRRIFYAMRCRLSAVNETTHQFPMKQKLIDFLKKGRRSSPSSRSSCSASCSGSTL